ncbi:MAG: DNA polymerase III subunit delta [Endozoicomonadaceae bacterium]|nr:DNA polymerase III subunit delta [Endozoicomonadaceae bacterium]
MKVQAAQLHKALDQLSSVYFITGEEIFQKEEACHKIRKKTYEQGYQEHIIYHIEQGFDWQVLESMINYPSLFSDKQCIELRIYETGQITRQAEKILSLWLNKKTNHHILLFVFSKFTKAMEKSAWFSMLEPNSTWIPVWKIEGRALIQWLNERVKQIGLTISYDALMLLAENTEGNLLAASQEIEKLPLILEHKKVTMQDITQLVEDSAQYDIFKLIDAFLKGDTKQVLRIFNYLQADATEWLNVVWVMSRELRILLHLSDLLHQGDFLDQAIYTIANLQKIPIFLMKKKRHDYLACLNRLNVITLKKGILYLVSLETLFKTGQYQCAKRGLLSFILVLSNPKQPFYDLLPDEFNASF